MSSSHGKQGIRQPRGRNKRGRVWLGVLVAFAFVAASCGDSSDSASNAEQRLDAINDIDVAELGTEEDDDGADDGSGDGDDSTADDSGDGDGGEDGDDGGAPAPEGDGVLTVGDDFDTIQDAVDAANPGDLVLIQPGTYNEAVEVSTENVTIRGLDRNEVILDGEFVLDNGFRIVQTDGVAIENLSIRNYTNNGVFFTGVTGYRASYITAQKFGGYGLYAFDSYSGQFDNSYTSGAADGGVYVGECFPCDAVVTDIVSEWNGLGFSGTNAGGDLILVNSVYRHNRAGIVPNSGMYEFCFPQRGNTIVGNLVHDNNNADTAAIDAAVLARGNGILIAGGSGNTVLRNRVLNHNVTNIAAILFQDEQSNFALPPGDPLSCEETRALPVLEEPISVIFASNNNTVRDNVTSDAGIADIALGMPSQTGNCFADNEFTVSAPVELEAAAPCGADGPADADFSVANGGLDLGALISAEQPPGLDYEAVELPDPGPQPSMPEADTAPARPATDVPMVVDLDAIDVPAAP